MVVSMLPSVDYALVRRYGQEQRQLARGTRGRLGSSTRSDSRSVSLEGTGAHKAQATKTRKCDRRQADSASGELGTMRDSKSKPRRRRPKKQGDDTGITLADMRKAQTAAVAAAAAGEVVRAQTTPVDRFFYWNNGYGMQRVLIVSCWFSFVERSLWNEESGRGGCCGI